MAELPQLVQLQQQHPEQVVTVSLNIDHDDPNSRPSEKLQKGVLEKLRSLGISSRNLLSSEATAEVLERYELFSIPAVLVYDREGRLARKFEGEFSYREDVFPLVEQLVGTAAAE